LETGLDLLDFPTILFHETYDSWVFTAKLRICMSSSMRERREVMGSSCVGWIRCKQRLHGPAKSVSWRTYIGRFFIPTLVGNIVGGVSLVAALGHAQVVGGRD